MVSGTGAGSLRSEPAGKILSTMPGRQTSVANELGPLPSTHGELTRAEVFDRSCRIRDHAARWTSSGADDLPCAST